MNPTKYTVEDLRKTVAKRQVSEVQVSADGITLSGLPAGCLSVDVAFDSHRVWTLELRNIAAPETGVIPWPAPLVPFLGGRTSVTVSDSANGTEYFRDNVRFSVESVRTQVIDRQGTHLVINKWGDLAPDLAGLSAETRVQLLNSTRTLISQLRGLGFMPFVVGGTLLGAVRGQTLLPHDDDADIAYLSHHTNPAEVAAESFALGHQLKALGYEFSRHSAAHIQLTFQSEDETAEYHIDIFSAFFTDDGNINQPFHVRGPFHHEQMTPFSSVTIDGLEFPAPADYEAWLAINYDENWRTPIPGYRLLTPEATVRRFENWFGGFNFRREFWSQWFEGEGAQAQPWASGRDWLSMQEFSSPTVLDLGCGSGALTQQLAVTHPEMRVIGADYAAPALALARATATASNLEFRHLNLYRVESLAVVTDASITGPFDVLANHVLEQVTQQARQNVLRIIRMALHSGGKAYATSHGMHTRDVTPEDPTGWHLDRTSLRLEALELGLTTTFVSLPSTHEDHARKPYGVHFSLARPETVSRSLAIDRRIMMNRLKSLIRRSTRSTLQTEIEELRDQVSALESELDEYRRHSLHVAEMLDLVEQRITFQGSSSPTE